MYRAPSQANLPHLLTLLNDVHGNIDQVARHLGLVPATLRKYKAQGQAPRAVMLAIFWESTWGRMTADAVAFNHAAAHAARASAYKRENQRLIEQIGGFCTSLAWLSVGVHAWSLLASKYKKLYIRSQDRLHSQRDFMLSYKELLAKKLELDKKIQKAHQEEAEEALATIKRLIVSFEFTMQQVFPLPQGTRKATEARYCDPNTGQTWSGQGSPPEWIEGKDRSAFEIDRTPVIDYEVSRDERNPFPVQ